MKAHPRLVVLPVAIVVALLWCALLAQAHLVARATVLDRLEASLLDLRILAFGTRVPPNDVGIVAIDDEAVRQAGAFPVPRNMLGAAVKQLFAVGAKAVVIDLLFLTPSTPENDQALAAGLAAGPAAIAAFLDFPSGSADAAAPVSCEEPIGPFRAAAVEGAANISLDPSGIVRFLPMILPCDGGVLPALSLRGAGLALVATPAFAPDTVLLGRTASPLDVNRSLALRYYGPERTIATISLAAVLDGRAGDFAHGRTIVIGATAQGVGDRYPTPFDSVLPGVEVIATGVANLQTGDALDRRPVIRAIDAAFIVLLGLAVTLGVLVPNVTAGLLAFSLLFGLWLGTVLVGFVHGVWLAMAMPLAAVAPLGVMAGVGRFAIDRWSERRLERRQAALGAFQPPAMLARMLDDPQFMVEPVERTVAVLFIDISGYTGLSERLDLRTTRDLLRQWHEIVEAEVAEAGGIVAAYMADGAMLVLGMLETGPDDARRAVETALRLAERTLQWLHTVEPMTGPLGIKVGGHYGPAALSRLGNVTHQHITATGDTINVASRLMAVAAKNGARAALSEALLAEAERQGLTTVNRDFAPVQNVEVKGRSHALAVRMSRAGLEARIA